MRIILGVAGGVAAYKGAQLLRLLTEAGHQVRVIPTASALRFVGEPTWAALSGEPVATEVWSDVHEVPHVRLGQSAELVIVAPATADLLAKAAAGLADDLLTNTLLTARCPVVFAPAMHTEMWQHPATLANVATLRGRGVRVLEPGIGRLTGADSGPGRLPEPEEVFEAAMRAVVSQDLAGLRVVVTAGGTREALDPVRYLGNRSSGRQGYALASVGAARGAAVTLVAANTGLPDPAGVTVVRVTSTRELEEAVNGLAQETDAIVMAAAPADFRPATVAGHKIKKRDDGTTPVVKLVQNPDILAGLVTARQEGLVKAETVLVGFAAETGDDTASALEYGRQKLARKGCDLLVVNEVSAQRGFESPDNAATILSADGASYEVPFGPKEKVATAVWDAVVTFAHRGSVRVSRKNLPI